MRTFNTLLTAVIALLMPLSIGAARVLTLDEAYELAEKRFPLVKEYGLIQLASQYNLENASKAWLPQISSSAQATYQSAVASYPEELTEMLAQRGLEMKGLDKFQYKVVVDVKQMIWDGGRVNASRDLTRAQAAESAAADDVELYHLRGKINDLFFGVLLLEQQRDALRATADLLEANLAKVNALVKEGAAIASAADAVEVELLSTRQQLISVESSIGAYRKILSLYTQVEDDVELVAPMSGEVADQRLDNRPEMRLFAAREASIMAQRKMLDAQLMPTIGAFAQGYYGYPGLNFMEAMMKRDPGFNGIVGITVAWDITPQWTKKNKRRLLDVADERIAVGREIFAFNTDVQATSQLREIARLKDIARSDSTIVALRGRVRASSEAQLREGVINPTDLLLRITEEKNARIAANTHFIELLKAEATLRYLYN